MGTHPDKSVATAERPKESREHSRTRTAPVDDAAALYRQALERATVPTGGPEWLAGVRSRALEQARARGLPGRREEDWRYIDLDAFGQRAAEYLYATAGKEPQPAPPSPPDGWTGARLALVDGIPVGGVTGIGAGDGCTVTALSAADPELAARFESLIRTDAEAAGSRAGLEALNAALFDEALLIAVEPGREVTQPLLLDLHTGGRQRVSQPRILVDLADNSRLTLVIRYSGEGDALVNAVTRVRCARGSHLRLIRLQAASAATLQVESTHVDLATGAYADITTVDAGTRLCRHDIGVRLAGEQAHCEMHGLMLASDGAEIDNHTRLEHRVPHTSSREVFRCIVADRSHAVFNGSIVVHKGAAGTAADLNNRNLLLARTGRVDTKPELEIYNDDVRCSHGSTTGQLDAAALFYLRSRGIDAPEARRLLIMAFAREVLESVHEEALRACVDRLLAERLEGVIP